jgi:hypothetical protein
MYHHPQGRRVCQAEADSKQSSVAFLFCCLTAPERMIFFFVIKLSKTGDKKSVYVICPCTSTSSVSHSQLHVLLSHLWSHMSCPFLSRPSHHMCSQIRHNYSHGAKSFLRSCSPTHEIPSILWNSKVNCHVHKSPPVVSILSQMNTVHTPHPVSLTFILILPPTYI